MIFRRSGMGGSVMAALMAVVGSLALAGWVAWDGWQRYGVPKPAQVSNQPAPAVSKAEPAVNVNAIINAHLFGRKDAPAAAPKPVAVAPTRLNLTLVGVVAANDATSARALIEVQRGRQEVVKPGETIGDTDATLEQVFRSHVLIRRNGQLEKLAMVRPGYDAPKKKTRGVTTTTLSSSGNNSTDLERLREEEAARLNALEREARAQVQAAEQAVGLQQAVAPQPPQPAIDPAMADSNQPDPVVNQAMSPQPDEEAPATAPENNGAEGGEPAVPVIQSARKPFKLPF